MPELIPQSPRDGTYVVEDFLSNDAVADATIGQLAWEIVTIANASTWSYLTAMGHGVARSTTAGTADGDGSVLRLFTDALILNGGSGGLFATRVRLPDITGNTVAGNCFRIGLDDSVTATSPTAGVWIDSAAGVLTLQCDSANGDVSAAVSNSALTSSTTMVKGTWYDMLVTWEDTNANDGPKVFKLFIDGKLSATVTGGLIGNDEEVELKIAHWNLTGSAATLELDVDYFELYLPR